MINVDICTIIEISLTQHIIVNINLDYSLEAFFFYFYYSEARPYHYCADQRVHPYRSKA